MMNIFLGFDNFMSDQSLRYFPEIKLNQNQPQPSLTLLQENYLQLFSTNFIQPQAKLFKTIFTSAQS